MLGREDIVRAGGERMGRCKVHSCHQHAAEAQAPAWLRRATMGMGLGCPVAVCTAPGKAVVSCSHAAAVIADGGRVARWKDTASPARRAEAKVARARSAAQQAARCQEPVHSTPLVHLPTLVADVLVRALSLLADVGRMLMPTRRPASAWLAPVPAAISTISSIWAVDFVHQIADSRDLAADSCGGRAALLSWTRI